VDLILNWTGAEVARPGIEPHGGWAIAVPCAPLAGGAVAGHNRFAGGGKMSGLLGACMERGERQRGHTEAERKALSHEYLVRDYRPLAPTSH